MKKTLMAIMMIAAFSVAATAQKGSKQISAGVELAVPTGDFSDGAKAGFGINGKGIFGITDNGAITATTGLTNFGFKGYKNSGLSVVPILGGYRHSFNGIYVEPQIGAGIYFSKYKSGDFKEKDSEVDFTWALGGGYVYQNFDFGIRYQRGQFDGGGAGYFGIKVAYNFNLGSK